MPASECLASLFTSLRFGVNIMWSTLNCSSEFCRLYQPVSLNQLWLKVTASGFMP